MPYIKHLNNTNTFFSFLAPLNAVTLGAQPNNLWTRWRKRGGESEHVTVIKCVLLPAVWQAPKYNSERIADRRPDGIGSRYLSEINKLWEKTTAMVQGGGEKKFGSLQRDFTVADIRDFTRDRSRTSKCFHIWHRYELLTVRGKGGGRGGGVGALVREPQRTQWVRWSTAPEIHL